MLINYGYIYMHAKDRWSLEGSKEIDTIIYIYIYIYICVCFFNYSQQLPGNIIKKKTLAIRETFSKFHTIKESNIIKSEQ